MPGNSEGVEINQKTFISFSSDFSSVIISDKCGVRVVSLKNKDLETLYELKRDGVDLIQRIFNSHFALLVTGKKPRNLQALHCKEHKVLQTLSFEDDILNIKIGRRRLVVCLKETAFIYSMMHLEVRNVLKNLAENYHKLCSLSSNNMLALPDKRAPGFVAIYDCLDNMFINIFKAHKHELAAISINQDGSIIATASNIGTLIRVFNVRDAKKLFELRRGFSYATIDSMAFSEDDRFLCCASNKETVHVFKLEKETEKDSGSWSSYFSKTVNYFAPSLADVVNEQRSFLTYNFPRRNGKTICGFAVIDDHTRVVVASTDGYLHVYDFDENYERHCPPLQIFHLYNIEAE